MKVTEKKINPRIMNQEKVIANRIKKKRKDPRP
jgi:hypothetical protein